MPLTTGELDRIRAELGYNLLNTGAEPYIGVEAIFTRVIQPYLREGNDTSSSTVMVASDAATFRTLVVADPTGIVLHEHIAVDVDDFFEMPTVRSVSGTSVGVFLKKAHAGTYPVTVDGGLQKVRECLASIYETHQKIASLDGTGNIKKVDEIEFYDVKGKSQLQVLNDILEHWRDQLRAALGIPRKPHYQQLGGSVSLY